MSTRPLSTEPGAVPRPPAAAVALPQPLVLVTLKRRVNRFVVEAVVRRRRRRLYLPNSGRMEELLRPGTSGMAHLRRLPQGRTHGMLVLIRHHSRWVGVDAHMPNRLFEAALRAGMLPSFRENTRWQREVRFGGGRIDFLLEGPGRACLVETKSCNRVDAGVALFPDAPTARGARHLQELADAVRRGRRAAVVWVVQRDDARVLRPYKEADPHFAAAARSAAAGGVEFYAYACRVSPSRMSILRSIPVEIP